MSVVWPIFRACGGREPRASVFHCDGAVRSGVSAHRPELPVSNSDSEIVSEW
jgi:hypothetical protein